MDLREAIRINITYKQRVVVIMGSIASNWRALSGENDWEGLLDPLNIDLRQYIIHYGERAGAIGDTFIDEEKSKNVGLSRYARSHLFSKVGLEKGNPFIYEVKKYFYGTTSEFTGASNPEKSAGNSNLLGYIAVTTDAGKAVLGRRDILISWRGTKRMTIEGGIDLQVDLVSAPEIFGPDINDPIPMVHHGWYSYYTTVDQGSKYNSTSCRDQVLTEIRKLVDTYKDEEMSITVTGHSMGAALAILNAVDIVSNGINNKPTDEPDKAFLVTSIVFASPRLGDQGFATVFSGLDNLHVLRIRNVPDGIPNLPPEILNYIHVGQELAIDTSKSPYLKVSNDFVHELEIYLHGVAGTQGTGTESEFTLEVNRDIALVNKATDAVIDDYNVVASWWTPENKSMVQQDNGSWILMDHEIDDAGDDVFTI